MNDVRPSPPAPLATASAAALEALAAEAWLLEPPPPHERKGVLRDEAAFLLDRLLTTVARGHGALEVAIGRGLAALAERDGAMRLGFSGIGDYARERLGIGAGTAQKLARLSRALRDRPLLAEAVRRGEVSARKAESVLPVARGEAQERWVALARSETVRALAAAVRAEAGEAGANEEPWERVSVKLTPGGRAKLDEAMALAGKVVGATAPRWQRLEAICQEFLGAHPVEASSDGGDDGASDSVLRGPVADWLEAAKAGLEAEYGRWAFLGEVAPVEAEMSAELDGGADAMSVDAELRRLAAMRDRWDELVGHLGMLLKMLGLWRDMGFASFGHYCEERLGMATRTVEQRVALERRLHALPALRKAMRERRVSYEQARLVADVADDSSTEDWIRRAEGTTCIALRRELEAEHEAQMCARAELDLRVPRRVGNLLEAAIRAARAAADAWLTPAECLERVAEHFIATWKAAPAERSTPQRRALARDCGLCQVPGCSRAAVHAHHVVYRSRGGGDEPENLASLCAAHHLRGVHGGLVDVRGVAPDRLTWRLGCDRRARTLPH
ncbi:HNH endonuclease [Anaeromyxobacter terrae]|uniref:HNH endonuclease n=1 Tax=Anaeromyxobacter terrae TaxID=2925406 RepID=UPI001F56858C|nr:HNH endonuclease signature motif containing protein [Anaeromyxobacter sp. SG22]